MTTKKHSNPLTALYDKVIERYCVERFLWPTYWPTLWRRNPRKITAGAIRRVRKLKRSGQYSELFYRISLARSKSRMEEWGALPPNPTGVWTSIGEKRFLRLWKKYKGDLAKISAATDNSTPSVKAYAEQLGLLKNQNP